MEPIILIWLYKPKVSIFQFCSDSFFTFTTMQVKTGPQLEYREKHLSENITFSPLERPFCAVNVLQTKIEQFETAALLENIKGNIPVQKTRIISVTFSFTYYYTVIFSLNVTIFYIYIHIYNLYV